MILGTLSILFYFFAPASWTPKEEQEWYKELPEEFKDMY